MARVGHGEIGGNVADRALLEIREALLKDDDKALQRLTQFVDTHIRQSVFIADSLRQFTVKTPDSIDTLLHTAALSHTDKRVVELLVEACPDLITAPRTESYEGQTALHITIAKRKIDETKIILKKIQETGKKEIFTFRAVGSKCKTNVMMGETPLSVAVLRCDTEMVDLLLGYGARIDEANSSGDTVVHSLIKYAALKNENSFKIINMLKHLKDKAFQCEQEASLESMWFKENNDKMTPLKLAVSGKLTDIFNALINMRNVFCFKDTKDGSFDTRYYDITEIDHIAQKTYRDVKRKKSFESSECKSCFSRALVKMNETFFRKPTPSVIEMMNSMKWKDVQPLLDTEIIKLIISKRWQIYRKLYYIFGLVHLAMMFIFTTSTYYRRYIVNSTWCKKTSSCHSAEVFTKVAHWILFFYGVFFLMLEFNRLFIYGQGLLPSKHHNNATYRASLLIFAGCLIIDCILYQTDNDENDVFVIALLCGCFFFMFFLRGFKKFSFYTVLYQKIIMGDLMRFGLIICIEFSAYTFAMYIILSGNEHIEEFSTLENTTLTMFGYMLGLKDLDFLNKVDTENQRIVAVVYVLFIVTSYIILLNSLIAMMSRTSEANPAERRLMTALQRSYAIIFLDAVVFRRITIGDEPVRRFTANEDRIYISMKYKQMRKISSKTTNSVILELPNQVWKLDLKDDLTLFNKLLMRTKLRRNSKPKKKRTKPNEGLTKTNGTRQRDKRVTKANDNRRKKEGPGIFRTGTTFTELQFPVYADGIDLKCDEKLT
ncbi:hypothetical protein Btru_050207 [Bulinus truncatus]|nr:hypothetical protein Btru_050207 [Bulinus truncatus]